MCGSINTTGALRNHLVHREQNSQPKELAIAKGFKLTAKAFSVGVGKKMKTDASAGNRTRINCLEGSYADHYTTDA